MINRRWKVILVFLITGMFSAALSAILFTLLVKPDPLPRFGTPPLVELELEFVHERWAVAYTTALQGLILGTSACLLEGFLNRKGLWAILLAIPAGIQGGLAGCAAAVSASALANSEEFQTGILSIVWVTLGLTSGIGASLSEQKNWIRKLFYGSLGGAIAALLIQYLTIEADYLIETLRVPLYVQLGAAWIFLFLGVSSAWAPTPKPNPVPDQ